MKFETWIVLKTSLWCHQIVLCLFLHKITFPLIPLYYHYIIIHPHCPNAQLVPVCVSVCQLLQPATYTDTTQICGYIRYTDETQNTNTCIKFTNIHMKHNTHKYVYQIYKYTHKTNKNTSVSNTIKCYFYKRGERLFCRCIVLGKSPLCGILARQHYSSCMQMTALKSLVF